MNMIDGKKLRDLRKSAGHTLKSIGEEIGVEYRMISYYEKEQRRPDIDVIKRLADAYGSTVDELYKK